MRSDKKKISDLASEKNSGMLIDILNHRLELPTASNADPIPPPLGPVEGPGSGTWFPLYNVIGINTYYESPLGYLLRELNPYVRNNSCTVMLDPDTYISLGYTTKPIYDINY